jgi:ABC-type lipoprotein release transport system permease subunit
MVSCPIGPGKSLPTVRFWTGRFLNRIHFLAYFSVSLLVISSSIVAMLIPALRTTRANPAHALREE